MTDVQRVPGSAPKVEASPTPTHRAPQPPQIGNVQGLIGAVAPPSPLVMGNQHLAIPGWTPTAGPIVVPVVGNSGGSVLTGMGEAETIVEVPPFVGAIIVIIAATIGITTTANNVGSPDGTRFSAHTTIAAGSAMAFVSAIDHDGHKKWFPILATAV